MPQPVIIDAVRTPFGRKGARIVTFAPTFCCRKPSRA